MPVRSLGLAERLGMRPLAARCRVALCEVYGTSGRSREGRESLEQAAAEFSRLGMVGCVTEVRGRLAAAS
jgi:hypothetical protein